ncbi:hypothetical protein BDZ85DRAFT_279307 [Elsinoe ampelina]|uniref:Uncharacterized protein n=1 Tax=Elsinoe ampelina TaxID=302913 RepID=A0A6A6GIU7_9PEZI|nr:hypothetical protein BDZ85DRAFT_279307 [Elsinoe ampelina]
MLFPIILLTSLAASVLAAAHPTAVHSSAIDYVPGLEDDALFEADFDGLDYYEAEDEGDYDDDYSQLYARSVDYPEEYEGEDEDDFFDDDDDDDWIAEYEPTFVSSHRVRTVYVPEEDEDDVVHELFRRGEDDGEEPFGYLNEADTNEDEFDDEVIPEFHWAELAGPPAPRSTASPAAKVIPAPTPAPLPTPASLTFSSATVGATAGNRPKTRR